MQILQKIFGDNYIILETMINFPLIFERRVAMQILYVKPDAKSKRQVFKYTRNFVVTNTKTGIQYSCSSLRNSTSSVLNSFKCCVENNI